MQITTKHIGKYQFDKWEENNKWYVKLYNNNAKKAWTRQLKYYIFRTEERADEYIKETSELYQSRIDYDNERKASKKNFVNPAKVGDILVSSWGYDQTNIDYYQVLEVKTKSVVIREIGKGYVENNGYGQDKVTPSKDSFKDDAMLKIVKGDVNYPNTYNVKITSYSWAYLWDGKPDYQTDAYSGH